MVADWLLQVDKDYVKAAIDGRRVEEDFCQMLFCVLRAEILMNLVGREWVLIRQVSASGSWDLDGHG